MRFVELRITLYTALRSFGRCRHHNLANLFPAIHYPCVIFQSRLSPFYRCCQYRAYSILAIHSFFSLWLCTAILMRAFKMRSMAPVRMSDERFISVDIFLYFSNLEIGGSRFRSPCSSVLFILCPCLLRFLLYYRVTYPHLRCGLPLCSTITFILPVLISPALHLLLSFSLYLPRGYNHLNLSPLKVPSHGATFDATCCATCCIECCIECCATSRRL